MTTPSSADAKLISSRLSDAKKREVLDSLSEDDFRDKVVRPLYRLLGLTHLRDCCGADELGKDCVFTTKDHLGGLMLIAVQTKTGSITMAGTKPSSNLSVIHTQLTMALDTAVLLADNSSRLKPTQVHVCTTGKISNSAREYLYSKLDGHRIKLLGADELIEHIDQHYWEFWLGVDAERFPYVRNLRRRLCLAEDVIKLSDTNDSPGSESPLLDENYVRLRLTRLDHKVVVRTKTHEIGGKHVNIPQKQLEPKFVDIAVEALPNAPKKLILITGEGGAGKTTALRRLAVTLIDTVLTGSTDAIIPVLLKARQVASFDGDLIAHAVAETTEISGGKCPFTSDDLEKGRVALMIDALEEADEHDREGVLAKILALHQKHLQCMIVVTSRDYRSILGLPQIVPFMHYWLLPIAIKEADTIIKRITEKKKVEANVIKTTLKRLHEAHGLTLSPMLLSVFLASADFAKQDLPPNIAEIFKKFTEQMIGRWDERKGLSQQYEANTKDFLLRQLAFQMHHARVRSIPVEEVKRLFAAKLDKLDLPINADRVFDEIVLRSGLLRSDGRTAEWRHHLLQEYFAGRGVPSAQFFATVVSDEWWRTPMIFYFGDHPEAFAELWQIVEKASILELAQLFDAAIAIGLAVQACYLAEVQDKTKTLGWVIECFARAMDEYRRAIDGREGGGMVMASLCATLALGRDAIATRTMLRLPTGSAWGQNDCSGSGSPLDAERLEAWRLIGLLEARELDAVGETLRRFRTGQRDLIFMLHLSVAWALYVQDPQGEVRKHLQRYLDETGPLIDDMRQKLFKEWRTLYFELRSGKVTPVLDDRKSDDSSQG